MLFPPFGSLKDSSGHQRHSNNVKKQVHGFHQLQLHRRMQQWSIPSPAHSPTMGMMTMYYIQMLTQEARRLALHANQPSTPATIFLAILALLAASIGGTTAAENAPTVYWAYLPNPPLFHVLAWTDKEHLVVSTNSTKWVGGIKSANIPHKFSERINFTGFSSDVPICFTYPGTNPPLGCLPTAQEVFLTDKDMKDETNPNIHGVWESQIVTFGSNNYNNSFEPVPNPNVIPDCAELYGAYSVSSDSTPRWLDCGFKNHAKVVQPVGTDLKIFDFSISSSEAIDINNQLKEKNWYRYNLSISLQNIPIHRWFPQGWVAPSYWSVSPHHNFSNFFPSLFRLISSMEPILVKAAGENTHIDTYNIKACLNFPYALLVTSIQQVSIQSFGFSYNISCSDCIITNCLDPSIAAPDSVFILLKQPHYVMVPVKVSNYWYDNSAMLVLKRIDALIRPKRFVSTIILGITALIGIVASVTAATTALVEEVHTASHVNTLSKNISFALVQQLFIDEKLDTKLSALEDAVIWLGNEVQSLKTMMSTKCHYEYKYLCVTPFPYNNSEPWEKVKSHLLGVWRHNDLSINIKKLQQDISAISKAHLDVSDIDSLATGLGHSLQNLNMVNWPHWLVTASIGLLLIILAAVLLPCLIRLFSSRLSKVRSELHAVHLRNKKGEIM